MMLLPDRIRQANKHLQSNKLTNWQIFFQRCQNYRITAAGDGRC